MEHLRRKKNNIQVDYSTYFCNGDDSDFRLLKSDYHLLVILNVVDLEKAAWEVIPEQPLF